MSSWLVFKWLSYNYVNKVEHGGSHCIATQYPFVYESSGFGAHDSTTFYLTSTSPSIKTFFLPSCLDSNTQLLLSDHTLSTYIFSSSDKTTSIILMLVIAYVYLVYLVSYKYRLILT
jgi:hypothetical protein